MFSVISFGVPSNLLGVFISAFFIIPDVDDQGEVCLVDFGISISPVSLHSMFTVTKEEDGINSMDLRSPVS